ncbi:MAG: sulfite exporter TauE/SafE family protein [Marinilabiliales bacterium]
MDTTIEYLKSLDVLSWQIVTILLIAGFLVGFINTMAGSGTIITFSVFSFLGLPVNIANGTIRLGVIMQTLAASLTFKHNNVLDLKKGLKLGIPVIIGSITGAQIAVSIDKNIFEIIIGFVMIVMLAFIIIKPERWILGKAGLIKDKPTIFQVFIFFLIGIYGGFIHIGVGIFLLAGLVLSAGYDLVRANALKVFIVLLYSPFALAVFMINSQIDYKIGLIAAIGNVFGGILGSRWALSWGPKVVRWFLIVVILLFTAKLFGLFNF